MELTAKGENKPSRDTVPPIDKNSNNLCLLYLYVL